MRGGVKVIDDGLLAEMWTGGRLLVEIAAALGVTQTTVQGRVRKLGLPRRDTRANVDRVLFAQLWEDGRTYEDIARTVGVGRSSIHHIARRLGMTPRRADLTTEGRRARAEAEAASAPPPRPAARACPSLSPHPFWTPERDALIWDAAGKHAALCTVAAAVGKPIAEVQRRWHMLRAGV